MKQLTFSSVALGLLLATLPVQAEAVKSPSTTVPGYDGGTTSAPQPTTSDNQMRSNSQAGENQVTNTQGALKDRNLPYYKTHGRGGRYLGMRP